jgi:DNA primase
MIHKEEIVKLLNLRPVGQRGWFVAQTCPYCGSSEKFGINFESFYKGKKISSFNCFSGKCGAKGSLYKLLKYLGRLDLISFEQYYNINTKLELKLNYEQLDIDYSMPEVLFPLQYKRISFHPYLEERGFTSEQFKVFNIGISNLEAKDYVVFILEENSKCYGWIARYPQSKEWINNYNEKHKSEGKYILRWKNSKGIDFEKFVFGIDEITEKTDTVIIVESITSKANVDRILDLYRNETLKCVATFGKKISLFQIKRIKDKGVKNVILIYDFDAVRASKQYSLDLNYYFYTMVGFIKNEGKDPGNLTEDELFEILDNLESSLSFNCSKLQKKKLLYGISG